MPNYAYHILLSFLIACVHQLVFTWNSITSVKDKQHVILVVWLCSSYPSSSHVIHKGNKPIFCQASTRKYCPLLAYFMCNNVIWTTRHIHGFPYIDKAYHHGICYFFVACCVPYFYMRLWLTDGSSNQLPNIFFQTFPKCFLRQLPRWFCVTKHLEHLVTILEPPCHSRNRPHWSLKRRQHIFLLFHGTPEAERRAAMTSPRCRTEHSTDDNRHDIQ